MHALPSTVGQLCAPWIGFGSSGLVEQPPCVTTANVRRRRTSELIGKCVVRVRQLHLAGIHRSVLVNQTNARLAVRQT